MIDYLLCTIYHGLCSLEYQSQYWLCRKITHFFMDT